MLRPYYLFGLLGILFVENSHWKIHAWMIESQFPA